MQTARRKNPQGRRRKRIANGLYEANITHPLGKARLKAGLSRGRVASELDVDYTTLWRWETERVKVPAHTETVWGQVIVRLGKLDKKRSAA